MLKEKIKADTIEALKSGDQFKLGVLRMLSAAISAREKEKRYKLSLEKDPEFSDQEVQDTITSEIKKRKDAIALYEQGKRSELAEREQKEIDIIIKYLPEQLSSEELKKIVQEAIEKTGAKEIKDTGKIMQELMPKVKGKADGGAISKIIKELLSK
jgi:hypothetical protein